MLNVMIYTLLFSIFSAISVVLMGDRSLIGGNLFSINQMLKLLFHWKFMLAMFFAIGSRFTFMMINNSLLKIPSLTQNSTTITVFVSGIGTIFIVIANYFYLDERLNPQQLIGGIVILFGIWLMLK